MYIVSLHKEKMRLLQIEVYIKFLNLNKVKIASLS